MARSFYFHCSVIAMGYYCLQTALSELTQYQMPKIWRSLPAHILANVTDLEVLPTTGTVLCSLRVSSTQPLANIFCFGLGLCRYGSVYLESKEGEQPQDYDCYYATSAVANTRPSCTPPFTQYSFGCMHFNTTQRNMSASAEYCENLGSSLASPATNAHFEDLRNFLKQEFGAKQEFWVQVIYDDGEWMWGMNRRPVLGPRGQGEWAPSEPDGTGFGARMMGADGYLLWDGYMSYERGVACHVWHL